MAKRRKISAKGFYLPYDAPQKVFQDRSMREFDTLRTIILTCGPSFVRVQKGLRRYHLDALVAIGWLKYVAPQKMYYQVSISKIFPRVAGTKRHFHTPDDLGRDVRAVLFDMDSRYLIVPFLKSKASTNRDDENRPRSRKKSKKLNTDSRHIGGTANSIIMERYKISLGYASKLRRLCEREGLGIFNERFRSTQWDTWLEGHINGDTDHLFAGYCGAWAQISSSYTPIVVREMKTDYAKDKNGYYMRRKIDQREVSNFVTGGAYSQ